MKTRKPSHSSKSKESLQESDNPTPRHFDKFLPWFCVHMRICPHVTVERIVKDERTGGRGFGRSRSKSKESSILSTTNFRNSSIRTYSTKDYSEQHKNTIHIKSYYNIYSQLIELAIIDCPIRINRKIIQAINVCVPFHSTLKKIKIKGHGLTETVLYEIGKLLPHSNITDICLDDTYVPEGNYYVLLDRLSQLKNLSLSRCHINDEVCKKIAEKLNFERPASETLLILDLTSNKITDLGAMCLGYMLRKNRTLLVLNLADNLLSDIGAVYILKSLMIFSLSEGELYELRKRKFRYSAKKLEMFKIYEQEVLDKIKAEENKENCLSAKSRKSLRMSSKPINIVWKYSDVKEQAEKMTVDNLGHFQDIFDNDNVIYRNTKLYSIGNLKLCYLNLAYNNMEYFSLKKLCEVLKYQSDINKANCKGLLKVVIDGNNIPKCCAALRDIQSYLINAVAKYTRPVSHSGSSKKYAPI